MKLAIFDPSSKVIGYAVMRDERTLIDGGLILPIKKSAPAFDRIDSMISDVTAVVRQHRPTCCLVEIPTHTAYARRRDHGWGLTIYGAGVGAVFATLRMLVLLGEYEFALRAVKATDWTGGKPKLTRQKWIALQFPTYHEDEDPGGDTSDAIGLGLWWLAGQRKQQGAQLRARGRQKGRSRC